MYYKINSDFLFLSKTDAIVCFYQVEHHANC